MTDPSNELMAEQPVGWWSRLAETVGDRLNPILVKETRQALKSKQFTLWFVLVLIACWITTIGAIAWIGPSIYYLSAGKYLLSLYYILLTFPLAVVVPFTAYRSLSSENEENTRDLLEVSTLTPRQVINGKLGSAALQIVIYLSALAPCLAFTYLLRGVSVGVILLSLLYSVLASIGLSAIGLVLAAANRQKYAQVVMSVAFAGVLFASFSGLLVWGDRIRGFDDGSLSDERFWRFNVGLLLLYATTLAVTYCAAIALTTFTAANRSTPLRIAVFVQQAVYVAWCVGVLVAESTNGQLNPRIVFAFFAVAAVYWFIVGALLSGESPTLSQRVRRRLPQSLFGRMIGTWFNPGGGSGYVFAVTNLTALTLLATAALLGSPRTELLKATLVAAAYVLAYLGLGRLAIYGVRKITEVSLLGCFLIQVLFVLGGSSLPYVVNTIASRVRVADIAWLNVSSPTWNVPKLLSDQLGPSREFTLFVALGATTLTILLINFVLAGREARQLRVAVPRRVIEDELELNPAPESRPTNPWGDHAEANTDPVTPV